jgi:hypothetical protein
VEVQSGDSIGRAQCTQREEGDGRAEDKRDEEEREMVWCGGCRYAAGNRALRCARRPTLFGGGPQSVCEWLVRSWDEAVMKSLTD